MIRFIDLTAQYFCNSHPDELDDMSQWAFIDTTTNKFLLNDAGSHLFDDDDINEHPQAERLRCLVPRKITLTKPLARAILVVDDIAFSTVLTPAECLQLATWRDLVTAAEAVTGRKANSTQGGE
jgi:hypothetical protein